MPEIYRKLDWLDKEALIKRMVSHEFNRFFEYYRDKEEIETLTDSGKGGEGKYRDRKKGPRQAEEGYVRLHINLGKIDHFGLRGLMEMLNDNTRRRVDVGRVDLMKKFSFFEVDEKETEHVLKAFRGLTWNGRKVVVEIAQEESPEEFPDDQPKGSGRRNRKRSGRRRR